MYAPLQQSLKQNIFYTRWVSFGYKVRRLHGIKYMRMNPMDVCHYPRIRLNGSVIGWTCQDNPLPFNLFSMYLKLTIRLPAPNQTPATLTALEQQIAELWQQSLGVSAIKANDDFFVLGGDSLLAVQLLARLQQTFQVTLDSHTLLRASTIYQLAQVIQQRLGTEKRKPSLLPRHCTNYSYQFSVAIQR